MLYVREDGCRAWLTCAALQPDLIRQLLSEYGTAEALYDETVRSRGRCLRELVTEKQFSRLMQQAERSAMHELMAAMAAAGIGILREGENGYPDMLSNISDAPPLLFFRGETESLGHPRCVTIVGTRAPTAEGAVAAQRLARELAERQVLTVSGMALGIDSAAHTGCMDGGCATVAVLACGLDVDYPSENRRLRERILSTGGVLLSEYTPGTPALRRHFTVRNRILSGLTRATVLMEARIKSGSMTTVRHALDQGREVFAYPGIPNAPGSEAAHVLLREGARYFTTAEDIVEDMDWQSDSLPTQAEIQELPKLMPSQQQIVLLLRRGSMSHDALVMETGLSAAELNSSLTLLQLLGLVRALPGKIYCIA